MDEVLLCINSYHVLGLTHPEGRGGYIGNFLNGASYISDLFKI